VALFAATSHIADVGGRGFGPDAGEVFEEGLRVPIMKLFDKGKLDDSLMRLVVANVRDPVVAEGDLYSLTACNRNGGAQLLKAMRDFDLDQLDDDPIFNAVCHTLEKHKDISSYAAVVTADLTILNLKHAPSRSEMSVDPASDSSIHLAAMEVLQRHFDSGDDVITRRKLAAQRFARCEESPRPLRSSFLKTLVYWYREDRPFLVFMSIYVLVILVLTLLSLRLLGNIVA